MATRPGRFSFTYTPANRVSVLPPTYEIAASKCLLISGSLAISEVTTNSIEPVAGLPFGSGHGERFKQFWNIDAPRFGSFGSRIIVEPINVLFLVRRQRSKSLESKDWMDDCSEDNLSTCAKSLANAVLANGNIPSIPTLPRKSFTCLSLSRII